MPVFSLDRSEAKTTKSDVILLKFAFKLLLTLLKLHILAFSLCLLSAYLHIFTKNCAILAFFESSNYLTLGARNSYFQFQINPEK
ncbi:unnamed protein product [Meloidogyne enterolobii]|uniref:Uncharacterized protein n=1 Tax=Meloidogyne enterolobii TaxID=390850 RepID=A0ACB0ZRM3_MELEN